MASFNSRKLMDKYMKSIDPMEVSEIFHLTIRPEYSSYSVDRVHLVCNFSETRNAFVSLLLTPPFRIVRAKDVEQKLIHTVTRTPYCNQNTLVFNRFSLNITDLPAEFLDKLINYIYTCQDPRVNYSWVEPLQDLLLQNTTPLRSKIKSKTKPLPIAGEPIDYDDNYVPSVKSFSSTVLDDIPTPKITKYLISSPDLQQEIIKSIAKGNTGHYLDPTGVVYRRSDHRALFRAKYTDYALLRDFVVSKKSLLGADQPQKSHGYPHSAKIKQYTSSLNGTPFAIGTDPIEEGGHKSITEQVNNTIKTMTVEELVGIARKKADLPTAAPDSSIQPVKTANITGTSYIQGLPTSAGTFQWYWYEDASQWGK